MDEIDGLELEGGKGDEMEGAPDSHPGVRVSHTRSKSAPVPYSKVRISDLI